MKDFNGDDLETGWYWYSHNSEGDIFHPVYVDISVDGIILDGKRMALDYMDGFELHKAVLPII